MFRDLYKFWYVGCIEKILVTLFIESKVFSVSGSGKFFPQPSSVEQNIPEKMIGESSRKNIVAIF